MNRTNLFYLYRGPCKERLDEGIKRMFRKREDDKGENKYRRLSFQKGGFEYIAFGDSVKCVFYANLNKNRFRYKQRLQYSKALNIPMVIIDWNTGDVTLEDAWEKEKEDKKILERHRTRVHENRS